MTLYALLFCEASFSGYLRLFSDVCPESGLILVTPASCRNSTRETLWNSLSVLTNVLDAQMWPTYWGWSLATSPGPFSQKLFRGNYPEKIILTRVGDRMTQRFTPDSVQKILRYALRVEVQHGYEYFAAGQLLTVFSVRIPAMQFRWTNRNRQWIEATNYCNQHDNDGAMIVLVKARKRNTSRGCTSRCCTTNSAHRRMNAPEIWLSMPKSSGVATCGVPENSRPSTVDTALWPRWIRPMAGMTSNSVRWILVCLLLLCLVCNAFVIRTLLQLSKNCLSIKRKLRYPKISLRPSPMRRTSGYWRNCQIQRNLYKCFGPCFLANQFAVVSLVIRCGNARAQRELRRWCLYL